ncbi:MAG: gliding motility-associated C-terminal domain-containing protein, partial [Crocinitomicaceae bacterium]
LQDYVDMTITWGDSTNICDEIGEYGSVWCNVQNGVEPYTYTWAPTPYANNDTISFPAGDLVPNLTEMSVNVVDGCGQNISSGLIPVYNQCALQVPNIITMNGDDINDEFIIRNIEDYDRVHLQIFNRWGNLVFESDDYQNDWKGKDVSGKELVVGVYTYVLTPESDKYEYDDQEKTRYTAHGFVHIVK